MRHWNNQTNRDKKKESAVFTLPMRHWNCFSFCFSFSFCSCFYSTYEALKLNNCIPNQKGWYSFYSTYEALKQFRLIRHQFSLLRFLLYLWGIETGVSRFWSEAITRFLLYLWGIETWLLLVIQELKVVRFYSTYEALKLIRLSQVCPNPLPFLLYLWGIETSLPKTAFLS